MHPTRSSLSIALLSALSAWALAPDALCAQSDRRTLTGSEVAIYNLAGTVSIEPGSGSTVTVEVTRRGRDGDRLRIETGDIGGRNTLRVVYPRGEDIVYDAPDRGRSSAEFSVNVDGTWGGGNRWNDRDRNRVRVKTSGDGLEAWADIRILVPAGKRLDVNLGVGELGADRVDASLRLDVAAARVRATGTRGTLSIDAGSGTVEVRDAEGGTLDIDTGSGSVRLEGLRSDTCNIDTGSGPVTGQRVQCDELSVDVGSGNVRLEDVRASRASVDAGSGTVTIDLRQSPRSLTVETGSGNVSLGLPSDIGAEVDIETGSGGITTEFGLQTNRYDRNSLRGRIGNGNARIQVETGSGSVRLRRV